MKLYSTQVFPFEFCEILGLSVFSENLPLIHSLLTKRKLNQLFTAPTTFQYPHPITDVKSFWSEFSKKLN